MLGDFNGRVNNNLDRQSKARLSQQEGKVPKSFFELTKQQWKMSGENLIQWSKTLPFTQTDTNATLELI